MHPTVRAVYVCGGGARNPELMKALQQALEDSGVSGVPVMTTDALGVPPQPGRSRWRSRGSRCAAWRALPGNLPAVTGAAGERVLGAIYPR